MIVQPLNQLNSQNLFAGGKARSLARMFQMKMPVPVGFVVFPDAFISNQLIPSAKREIETAVSQLWPHSNALKLAVRSSGIAEDSAQASFAGEFETELNVSLGDSLFTAIESIYNSRHAERVAAYQKAQGLVESTMAIIVQEMVPAELAGVLFTVDGVNGRLSYMVGNAIVGLGDALVSGEETGLAFQLARPKGKLISEQAIPILTPRLAQKLYRYAAQLEEKLGTPQDIEWAIANGKLHLLQTRPISTLQGYSQRNGSYNSSRQGEYLWTNSNFGEAIPDVMTPATWSIVKIFMGETIPFDFLNAHPVMGNIGGRFYMNMTIAASLFMGLGFSRERLKKESQEFFGNIPSDLELPIFPLGFWSTLRKFLPIALETWRRVRADRPLVDSFAASVPAKVATLTKQVLAKHKMVTLATLWDEEIKSLFVRVSQLLQAGTSGYENRYRKLHSKLKKLCSEEDTNMLLTGLSTGNATLASMAPLLGLSQVKSGQLTPELYAQQFGHRGPHEFELSWPRPSESVSWIADQIENLSGIDPAQLMAQQAKKREIVWQRLLTNHPRKAKKIEIEMETAVNAAQSREQIRSEMIRIIALIRTFYLQAAKLLAVGEDVFFLEYDELLECLRGCQPNHKEIQARQKSYQRFRQFPPYPGIIVGRFDPEAWAANPNRRHDLFDARQPTSTLSANVAKRLTGFAGAAGQVRGIVRRLDRPEDGHLLQPGEILVTSTTNVGWTPLFPKAAAIITDVGAPLSHAAIVARELGIPAVVGTGNATQRLQNGDWVIVNGGEGWVQISEESYGI